MIQLSLSKIKTIEAVAQESDNCISFSQGTLKLGGIDLGIKEYTRQILLTDKADYYQAPIGIVPLRKKLAESLSKQYQVNIGLENIMISHGAIGALTSLCSTVLAADDEVILPEPTYPVYQNIVHIRQAQPILVPASTLQKSLSGENRWLFDINTIKNAITKKTRMIILANPSNPTGSCLSQQTLDELKAVCEKNGIYLVVDEIYDDFLFEGSFCSVTKWAVQSPLTVRIGSFSKAFAMSGWRVGFLVGNARLINAIMPVQEACFVCPTVTSQYATLYALEHKQEILAPIREELTKSKELINTFFSQLQGQGLISYAPPQAGFYLFFKTNNPDSTQLVYDIIRSAQVAMVPGADFGSSCTSFVRCCFARRPEVVAEGIKRLQHYFSTKLDDQSLSVKTAVTSAPAP